MTRDALLAIGLLLSTASQLRIPGALGFGPGEVALAMWVLLVLADAVLGSTPKPTPALFRLLIFWAIFTLAQCIGVLVGLAFEEIRDTDGAMRTTTAYVLGAVLSCLAAAQANASWRLRRSAWIMVGVGALAMTVLVAGGYGIARVPGIHLWVFRRFVGWSSNPNQFALLCTVLVLVALHLAETAGRAGPQLLGLVCAVPPFLAGILTRSDSLILGFLVAGPMFFGIKLLVWAFWSNRGPPLRATSACLVFLSVPGVLVALMPFSPEIGARVEKAAVSTMEQNNQAEGRFRLWRDAMDVGFEAGMLGLGPGPHLVSKQWKMAPPLKNEAHNTVLDLFTQGGLLASLSFLWITGSSLLLAYRANYVWLAALILSLLVFSNFHLIARHPIFWFSLVFCLTAATTVQPRGRVRRMLPHTLTIGELASRRA